MTREGRPRVAALLFDGVWSHDLANIIQVFGDSAPLRGEAPCELALVSAGSVVSLDHGLSAATVRLSDYGTDCDLVCVPGFVDPLACLCPHADDPATAPVREGYRWLRDVCDAGAEVASLGSGAFVLAWADLLDGVRCTTHHAYAQEFSKLFPLARLCPDTMLTRDDGVWTSAGGASGLDLCVSMLAHLAGSAAASSVSEAMSLWRPHAIDSSSQAFGIPSTPAGELAVEDVDDVCRAVLRDLAHPWRVDELARRAGMSVRTFERHFVQATGDTPKRWIVSQRLAMARDLLEQTDLPLPLVASRVGIGSADVLYRCFVREQGESPSAYRRRFRSWQG